MRIYLKDIRRGAAILITAFMLAGLSPNFVAFAQTTSPPSTAAALSESTIKALQEALTKQGIAVKADGALNDETRAAIRQYQSQHHLPVTGQPDKATLDKLGVAAQQGVAPEQPATTAQATPPADSSTEQSQVAVQPAQTPGGMMMSGPMMQGMMQGMMQTMQGMMGMMQGQMQPGAMQRRPMGPPQAQAGMMMNCPMMPGASQGGSPAMMAMMQGMMQMMQMMQNQMQPGQMQSGPAQPGQMQPERMGPGQMGPGRMPGGPMQPRQN